MAFNSVATNPGVMPFIMGADPNDQSAQANAARAAAGNPIPPIPGQAAAMPVMPSYSVSTVTDPTNQTTKIVEDDRTRSAEAAMGEAKTARLDAVDMQAEADKEAEMNAGLKAQEEANALAAENTALKANQVERDRRLQEATAREAAQQAAVEKAAKPTGYWQDMSTPRRVLAAIFMGMDASQGSNNVAKIYSDYAAEDRQRKVDALNAEVNKLSAMGKDRVRLQEYYQQRAEEISREEIANGKIMVKQIEATGKKFPQWAAKAEAAKAAILDDTAGKEQSHAIQMAAKLTHEDKKRTVSETTGKAEPGANKAPTESEAKLGLLGNSMKEDLARIEKGDPLTSDDLDKLQSNTLASEAADKSAEKGQIQSLGIQLGRSLGGVPKSRYSGLTPGKQQTANAYDNVIEKYARVLTGAGMPAEEARRMSRQAAPNAGDSPEMIKTKLERLNSEADRFVALAGPKTAERLAPAPAQPQAAAPAAAAPSAKSMVSGIARALKVKPGDPNYEAAQEFLKTHAPGRKGKN